jgi:hypothetical protein
VAVVGVVVCWGVWGSNLLKFDNDTTIQLEQAAIANSSNWFNLAVFAAEQQPDGTVTVGKKLEFGQNTNAGARGTMQILTREARRMTLMRSFAFSYEGENIAQVTLSVDQGYFGFFVGAREEGGSYIFEQLGKNYTVATPKLDENKMFFWGIDYPEGDVVLKLPAGHEEMSVEELVALATDPRMIFNGDEPRLVTIKAVATFINGQVQEQAVSYDLNSGSLILHEGSE